MMGWRGPARSRLAKQSLASVVSFLFLASVAGAPLSYAAPAASAVPSASAQPVSLSSPAPETNGAFGFSESAEGGLVAVGAWGETVSGDQFAGNVYVYNDTTGSPVLTLTSPNPQLGGEFGYSVAVSGGVVAVGAPLETRQGLFGAGNVYLFSAKTGALFRTLGSPNIQADGEFGFSVALKGSIVVVGAPQETTVSGKNVGEAFVFNAKNGGVLAALNSPNAETGGEFGDSVALGGYVVVGAPLESSSGLSGGGNAYLFSAAGGSLACALSGVPSQKGAEFGFSVAAAGGSVVVGAPSASLSGVAQDGAAYTFDSASCALLAALSSPSEVVDGMFGYAVATNGRAVLVGAPLETSFGIEQAGKGYAFGVMGGELEAFASPHSQYYGEFGGSVAVDGGTAVIGAWGEFSGGNEYAGNAYINPRAPSGAPQDPLVLASPGAAPNEQFGWSVGTDGSTVAVGAYFQVGGGTTGGAVYTFAAPTGEVTGTLVSPNAQPEGEFGYSVAVGNGLIVVGAPFESSAGITSAGNAYVFNATDGSLVASLGSPAPQYGGNFGTSVAVAKGVIVVGAPLETSKGLAYAGMTYVFSSTTDALVSSLSSPRTQARGFFGWSVATDGKSVLVGAIGEQVRSNSFAGHVYIFSATTGGVQASLMSPYPQRSGDFGASVSLSSGVIVVGADGERVSGSPMAGHAYLFNASTDVLLYTLSSPAAQSRGLFGSAVTVDGTTAVVGAGGEVSGGFAAAGNVYTFDASSGTMTGTLTSPNAQPFGSFGDSVASGQGIGVVGAPYETLSTGYAYVFPTG